MALYPLASGGYLFGIEECVEIRRPEDFYDRHYALVVDRLRGRNENLYYIQASGWTAPLVALESELRILGEKNQ